jgi:hypothetical protein
MALPDSPRHPGPLDDPFGVARDRFVPGSTVPLASHSHLQPLRVPPGGPRHKAGVTEWVW